MPRTIAEINERVIAGQARVLTIQDFKAHVSAQGVAATFEAVDVVTTGAFEPMESCGAILNIGHTDPPLKMRQVWLNDVPAYAGFGAVDLYLGAAQLSEEATARYGGSHVIADLVAGKTVNLRAIGQGTDCYPRTELDTTITKDSVNQFYLFNPRGLYQNFIVGVNGGDRPLYTYLGPLQPRLGNAVYASGGALSPLLNDPELMGVGIGSRIWLGGGEGYIAWEGTQHFPNQKRLPNQTPVGPAATVALIGDAKLMQPEWVRGCYLRGYGASLLLGVGIALPVLSPEMVQQAAVAESEVVAPVIDFAIPRRVRPTYGLVSYAQLKSGHITIQGKSVRVAPLSSQARAFQIAECLKAEIDQGRFLLTEPVAALPRDRDLVAHLPR